MTPIPHTDLVIMNDLCGREPLAVDLVYAHADHPENIFGVALYRPDAPCLLHTRLAAVVVLAARDIRARYGWTLVIKDGLRTTDAQAAVFDTAAVKAHPEWVTGPDKMFADVGQGGHPRGMAVDVSVVDDSGEAVDFGTVFDAMPEAPGINAGHRNHDSFDDPSRSVRVLANRQKLTQSMLDAACDAGEALWPLRQEWWDYRFIPTIYNGFAPIADADLPDALRLTPKG